MWNFPPFPWFPAFPAIPGNRSGPYSVSHIQDYIRYIIKNHKTLTATPVIYVYINEITNRLVFEIKDGYKLELQMLETPKLFGSTKNE